MKPWEGKHFKQLFDEFCRRDDVDMTADDEWSRAYARGSFMASLRLKKALEEDWEEQQKESKIAEAYKESAKDEEEENYEDNYVCPAAKKTYPAKLIIGKTNAESAEIEKQNKPIIYHEEWGGSLRAIIDGKPQNIADHMNKKYIEKENSGCQESFRPQSFLAKEKEDRLIKNLMMTISMQRDEMDELKRRYHDEKKDKSFNQELFDGKYGQDYWFKFRDSIYEVGKPSFSIVSNGEDEHPNKNIIRISDCNFDVFIDIWGENREDSLERAQALCDVLNAEYPFHDTEKAESFTSSNGNASQVTEGKWIKCADRLPEDDLRVLLYDKHGVHGGVPIDIDYREGDFWHDGGIYSTITHWMPLPKPPEEE